MNILKKYHKFILLLVFAVILIAIYKTFDNFQKIIAVFDKIWDSLTPFVVGFVIAYVLNIPCKKIEEGLDKSKYKFLKKNKKAIAITSVYLVGLLAIYIVIRSLVPAIYKNVVDLYYNVPKYFDDIISSIVKWQSKNGITLFEVDKMNAVKTFNKILSKIDIAEFAKYAQGVVKLTSGVINLFIGIIASIYMLIDKERIKASSKRLSKIIFKSKSDKVVASLVKVNEIFSKYLFCLLVDALLMAVLATIILSLLRVKYSLILGMLIGICNLIPYFGAIISAISAVVITVITGGIFKAIWVAVALLLLQQIDGNFIGPKIMGQMLNISPLWIIFAVTLGGGLFGIAGMVISVPLFMVIKMLLGELLSLYDKHGEEIGENGNE